MRISRVLLFGLCLLLFPLFISIPNSYSESELYENQEHGFTIEHPSEWILNDTIPQKNKWLEIVSFLPDTEDWSQGIYVYKWVGDLKDKDFNSTEYLENHNKAAQDWCSSLSISENGFECMNYSLVNQTTTSISGRDSFLLVEIWTRIEGETSSEVLVYNLQIPDGEDRWTIIAESKKGILNETSNILKNSLDSFTLLKELQNSLGIAYFPPPLKQIDDGIEPTKVTCTEGLELVLKSSNGNPACLKPSSVSKLIERGWAIHILPDYEKNQNNNSEIFTLGNFPVETKDVNYFQNSKGYLAKPNVDGQYPAVIMIHEWWGLNENIRDMAEKLASHGYIVFAVDLYDGEVATTSDEARELRSSFDESYWIENMNLASSYVQEKYSPEKIGSIGWCFGGGQSLNLALNNDAIDATVIYYGSLTLDKDQLSSINWPILGIFAELDSGIPPETVNQFETALNDLQIENDIYIYPDVNHAFANPSGERYAPEASMDAWQKTIEFFEMNLK